MIGSDAQVDVLVADETLRAALVEVLSGAGFALDVPPVDSGGAACRAATTIVLADPPAADCLGAALRSRRDARPGGEPLLLIVLPEGTDAAPWLAAGFDDVVRWPMAGDELVARLHALTRLRRLCPSRWRAVLDAIDHPVFVVGPDFKIAAANRALGQIHGVDADKLVGRPCWDVLHAPGRAEQPHDCPLRTATSPDACGSCLSGRPYTIHAGFDGRSYQISCTPVVDDRGRLLRAIHVATDITDRVRTEETLRASEARLRTIFEGATEGIVTADGKTQRLSGANPAFCQMLGYTAAEIERLTVADIHPPEALAHVSEKFERQLRGEITCAPDLPVRRKDGSVFFADITAFPVRIGGRDRLVGFFRDVTERKRVAEEREVLETQLRHAQKMEAVGRLAGGVAHDFNNILMAITGNVEAARSLLGATGVDGLEEPLEQIAQAAGRAATLTRELLAFSRREVSSPRVIDLNGVLRSMERMFAPALTERVRISLACDPELPPVRVDPRLIEQVVVNLLINARDAMPQGGLVRLTTSTVLIDQAWVDREGALEPGPHVKLVVEDDGCGMDPETTQRIFEPFFTTKEMGQGTGLGLATVYGIIKQAGGHIVVDSELGQGTAFSIYLPAASGVAGAVVADESPAAPIRRGAETILLCEDDEVVLGLTARMLRAGGYRVLTAGGGGQAMRMIEHGDERIDLVVTDVVMPEVDGIQLAQELADRFPTLPLLFISGYPSDVISRRGLPAERIEFLAKPFTRNELLARVRDILDTAIQPTGPVS